MKLSHAIYILICLLSCSFTYATDVHSPLGLWRTYDLDATPRSVVKFSLAGSELRATIVKTLNGKKGQPFTGTCTACTGNNKNKPLVGITIIWGLKKQDNGEWTDGHVLDTDSGSTYRCNITLSENGQIMHFHAYLGMSFLGKTVDWQRVTN